MAWGRRGLCSPPELHAGASSIGVLAASAGERQAVLWAAALEAETEATRALGHRPAKFQPIRKGGPLRASGSRATLNTVSETLLPVPIAGPHPHTRRRHGGRRQIFVTAPSRIHGGAVTCFLGRSMHGRWSQLERNLTSVVFSINKTRPTLRFVVLSGVDVLARNKASTLTTFSVQQFPFHRIMVNGDL
ncbi:uncharacterized protein [Triticum aestivum]|uniref:uncharacterized protein n=1 Tax=Triticum aestivum TaxID=4565 RepID=UPI001D026E1B|nr:uncharacterized protein LOC123139612 [Triticum aestivum]